MIIYPDKPWQDGQTFEPSPGVTATFSTEKNGWSFIRSGGNVSTKDVLVSDLRPDDEGIQRARNVFEESEEPENPLPLATQQDINWYLYELINSKL